MKRLASILAVLMLALCAGSATATTNRLGSVKASEYVVTAEDDPTVPSWAKQSSPPESMTDNAVVLTNNTLKTKGGDEAAPGYLCLRRVGEAELVRDVIVSTNGVTGWHYTSTGTGAGYWSQFSFDWWNLLTSYTETDPTVPSWAKQSTFPGVTTETDPTVPSWAKSATKPSYSASEIAGAATTNQVEGLKAIVYTWEGFLDGSNVVFSITNYISGTYSLDTAKLRILELRDGVYREVYNSHDEIDLHVSYFRTNDFRIATNAVIRSVDSKIAAKADKDWGKYTSAGGEAPSNTVYMTAPNTVFAGGMEYQRVAVGEGAVAVLTTKGAPTYTTGDEGTFKFQDDGGTNYFGFAKSDSYVIGCDTDGIAVSAGIVTLTYNVTMSGVPCIWYKADLATSTAWEQLNLPDGTAIAGASHVVSWEATPAAGTEVCYINCASEAKGFFKATIEVAGSAKFMTNMPADLGGGILCTNTANNTVGTIKPTYNGSSVTWTWTQQ